MVAKLNVLNASRFCLMVIFTAVLFNSLHVNADKKFEINKNHTSAKAIVSEKKEFNATVGFDPADYSDNKDRNFDLIVGGCKLSIEATKNKRGDAIDFKFYNGNISLGSVPNPKSFLVQEQSLTFYHSTGSSILSCGKNFEFNPIEGQGNFTIEVSLVGDIPDKLVFKSDNLIYDESESEKNAMLWVWISVGVGSFLLIAVIVAIGVGICIYRKRKAVTKNKLDALATAAPIAEESKMPVVKELSAEQKLTSDVKPTTSTTKTSEPPQVKKQIPVVEVEKKAKAGELKAKNGQVEKTSKAKNDKTSKKVSKKKEALKTAIEVKPRVETKPAPSKQVEEPQTPMRKPVNEVKPDKKKNSKTNAKVKAKASMQEPVRSRIYHKPEDEGSERLSDDGEKPDKISPTVSVKTPTLSKDSKTRSKNSSTTECTSNTKTTLDESTAKSMDSTQESSKRSTLKTLDSTQETSSKRSVTGETKTID